MKWLDSFTLVMRSSITTLREKVEDPERMLHQLICDMEEELEAIRASVAAAIADEIGLRKQADAARQDAETWMDRARAALRREDEADTKAALDQKLRATERAEGLQKEHDAQKAQTAKLQESFRDLEGKIRQARQKRTLLVARMARAESSRKINRALDRAEGRSAFAQFGRLEQRVERSEALSEAYDRLEGRDPDAEELARRFSEEEHRERLESELETLKQQAPAPQE
ncbi:MAG: PspA/IM30 family protein [Planctomycetaceae bacterium]